MPRDTLSRNDGDPHGHLPHWSSADRSARSKRFDEFLKARLGHVEPVLAGREWLAGSFSVADILMADADQMAHFASADAKR